MMKFFSCWGIVFSLCAFFLVFSWGAFGGEVVYVKHDATGEEDGTSWVDAYVILQDGLDDADSGDEIWVSSGTYKPTKEVGETGDRYKSFQLKNGVAIYGGFEGGEVFLDERDWANNVTVLSGDIGVAGDSNDNCYHVFYHPRNSGIDNTAILDGFSIIGGRADGSSDHRSGGGMYNRDASPIIRNCVFEGNFAGGSTNSCGGAINNYYSSAEIINCTFRNNTCEAYGGAISNTFFVFAKILNCVFENNRAGTPIDEAGSYGHGGAIYNSGNTEVVNCVFENNAAKYEGGAIYNKANTDYICCVFNNNEAEKQNGGAIYNHGVDPCFINCIMSNNKAMATGRHGGAMYNYASSPSLINCTIYKNEAGCYGDGISNFQYSDPIITNCILWSYDGDSYPDVIMNTSSSEPVVTYCIVQGGYGEQGDNNSDENPMFVDADNGDLRVSACPPAIDGGINSAVPADTSDIDNDGDAGETMPYDVAFKLRIFDYECGEAKTVDIGAYEYTSANHGDIDGDCKVNMIDYSLLAGSWQTDDLTVDLYPGLAGNCVIDMEDLEVLCFNWLSTGQ